MYCGCGERLMDILRRARSFWALLKLEKLENWTAKMFYNIYEWNVLGKINICSFQVLTHSNNVNFNFAFVNLLKVWELKQFWCFNLLVSILLSHFRCFSKLNLMLFKTDAFNEGYFHNCAMFNRFCLLLPTIKHLIKFIK